MARENRSWGYDRIAGALQNLGYSVSVQTLGTILHRFGIAPAPLKGKVGFALTEWLFRGPFAPAPPNVPGIKIPEYRNLGGAICAVGILNMLIREANIVPVANMTGLVDFGRLGRSEESSTACLRPGSSKCTRMRRSRNYLEAKVVARTYDTKDGSRRAPNVNGISCLDVVGTSNTAGDKLTIFVINRSLTNDLPTSLKLAGFNVCSAKGTLLEADTIYTGNDDAQPEAVIPKPFAIAISGSDLSHVFPKSSISMLELSSR